MSCGTGGQAGLSARCGYAKSKQTGEPELRLSGREGGRRGPARATRVWRCRPREPPRPARDCFPTRLGVSASLSSSSRWERSDPPTREIPAHRKGINLLWSRSCRAECCPSWGYFSHPRGCSPAQARGVFVPSRVAEGPSGGSQRPRSPRSQSISSCSAHPGCRGRDGRCPPCSREGHRVSRMVPPPCPALPVPLQLPGPPKATTGTFPPFTGEAAQPRSGCHSQESIP